MPRSSEAALSLRYLSLWARMCLDITFTAIEMSNLG